MTTFNLSDPGSSPTSYLTTELNSLADGGNKLGADINNEAGNMYTRIEVSVATQGSARAADASVDIFAIKSSDGGTTFGYGSDSLDPPVTDLLISVPMDAAVTARVLVGDVQIPAGHFKLLLINETGQAFAATGNTMKYSLFTVESNA